MIDTAESRSISEFQSNIKEYVGRLKDSKSPLVLTIDGHPQLIVQDAESYRRLLERLEDAETTTAIRRGIEQFNRGEGIPLDEVEERLRKKHGFSS